MSTTTLTRSSFDSVEQLDAMPQELGWPLQYRQLEPGAFSSTFAERKGEGFFLMEERSSRAVEVVGGAIDDMLAVGIVDGAPIAVNGQQLGNQEVFLQSPGADFRATVPAECTITQIGIATEAVETVWNAMSGPLAIPSRRACVLGATPPRVVALRRSLRSALYAAGSDREREEAIDALALDIADCLRDRPIPDRGADLHGAAALRTLRLAQEYIEAHLDTSIRISVVCVYAGTSARSLERIFFREVHATPQQYVKIRRLNAARRRLLELSGEPTSRVSTVAENCGFTHMGRFSRDYRRLFNESPRETLRAGKA